MHNTTQTKWLSNNGWTFDGRFYKQHGHMINQRQADHSVKAVPAYLCIYSERGDDVFVCELIAENGLNQSPRFIKSTLKNCFTLARDHYGACRRAA